jgi:opacity protein-like surface antigen
VLNINTMFGPFAGLSFYAGAQAEQTKSHGFTDARLTEGVSPATTNLIHTTNNKQSIEETAGLRYTKIPFTTLYAEGKWTQEDIDLLESETQNGAADFARDTDTTVGQQDYTAGFNTAPLPRMTLAGRYRHSIYENGYDHQVDTEPGYPAFIKAQNFTTDEITAKLTVRPLSRFSMAFKYQLVDTKIDTTTDALFPLVPGGTVRAGNYDAAIYSVSATVTPLSRLYLTGLFSFQDTKTTAFDNGSLAVVDYVGNVYTVIGAAGYALDNKTDLTAEYTYSRADDAQNNAATGLPLGLAYQQTGVLAGLSRQLTKNMIVRLRYGFYEYHETSNGGINNYIAHLASATCSLRF